MSSQLPAARLATANDAPLRPERAFVLYWMVAARRAAWSFALDRAVELARALGRPLVILEALRVDYPFASDRLHRFVLDGMRENAKSLSRAPVLYHPYVEAAPGQGRGLLEALASRACAVVTDLSPTFFLPRMVQAAAGRLDVRMETVDGCGLLPLSEGRAFARALDLRRHLQRHGRDHLRFSPRPRPFQGVRLPRLEGLPREVTRRWPAAEARLLAGTGLEHLPIDHAVAAVATRGGSAEAKRRLGAFLGQGLARYAEDARHPDAEAVSGLSPYLHFGQVSPHEVFAAVSDAEGWTPEDLSPLALGRREGWWGMGAGAEAFLDQLVVWRELGQQACHHGGRCGEWEGLPAWARATLEVHVRDPRPRLHDLASLEEARTDDPLWNACQRALRTTGTLPGYLRMLWGKRVITWTRHPREALGLLLHLNDRWALDGRDPNSHSGISWCFGRYDRPWPEQPVFGAVRRMTSQSTGRKLRLGRWLARFGQA